MTTERPDGTQGDLESPKGSPAEALRETYTEAIKNGYVVTTAESMILYNPGLVSIRKKVLSA